MKAPADSQPTCSVCGGPLRAGTMCPRCRTSRPVQRKMSVSGWAFVSGAILLLVALGLWASRLEEAAAPAAKQNNREPVPDSSTTPGQVRPVAFAGESCRPWLASRAVAPERALPPLLLLTSRLADPYGLVAAGFARECGRQQVLVLEELSPGKPLPLPPGIRLAVAVGAAAAERLVKQAPELPLAFALVPDPLARGLDGPSRAGVSMWLPDEPLVRHWLQVLPEGPVALFHPADSLQQLADAVRDRLRESGRKVVDLPLRDKRDLDSLIARAGAAARSWAVLVDRQVIDDEAYNRLQVAAEKKRLPLAVSDEEHVRVGALVGVGTDSHRVGRQLCHLAAALAGRRLPEGSHVFCPEYSFAVVHQAVAEKLGYLIDFTKVTQVKVYRWH